MNRTYKYLQIYNELKDGILSGKYSQGDCLATESELQAQYGISRITVKKAMEMLSEEGLVERFPGKGTFVSGQDPAAEPNDGEREPRKIIGVVMSGFSDYFGSEFLRGVSEETNRQGWTVMAGLDFTTTEDEREIIQRQIENGARGIVAMMIHSPTGVNTGIVLNAMMDFPIVLADRYLEGLSLPYVGTDNADAAYKATMYLFELGHKHIGLVSSGPTTTAITERESGYMRAYAMSRCTVRPEYLVTNIRSIIPEESKPEIYRIDVERMKRYFVENPDVTALLCIDYSSMKICEAAAQEAGLRVPEDLSLVCFDAPGDGPYTHIRQPEKEMGIQAVRMLLDVINGNREPKRVLLPAELRVGRSTGKPRR